MYQADENRSFEAAHLIKSFELFELTICLLEQETKAWVIFYNLFFVLNRLVFH